MLKEKIQQLKENMTKSDNKTGKKKVENLIVGILILIVTVIAINTILADDNKKETSKGNNTVSNTTVTDTTQATNASLEERLEGILAKIRCIN